MPRTPSQQTAIEALLESFLGDLHVALPGVVQAYDGAKQTADIKPMVKRVARGADDDRLLDSFPVIAAVPVAFPRGGGFSLHFPVATGDTGLLIFAERDLGPWRATGQDSDPLDEGLHTLAGAVFFPGLHTTATPLASTSDLVLAKAGGPSVHVTGSTVDLGASGGQFVALGNLVALQLHLLKDSINAWSPNAGDGGAALKVALTAWLASSSAVAATIARAT